MQTELLQDYEVLRNECEELRQYAEECIKFKQNIIANISHEIRTPMNAILGFSEMLINDELTEKERKEYFEIIKRSSEQMQHIIQSLIEISELQSSSSYKNNTFDLSNIDILRELKELKREFEHEANTKGLDIVLAEGAQTQNSIIKTDYFRLHKALWQLIKNAIQYTKQGIIELGYSYKNPNYYEIYVKDSGCSIPENKVHKIFEAFFQIDMSLNRNHSGLGLGLSLAKSYAKQIGGDIIVEQDKSSKIFKILVPNDFVYNS